MDERKEGIVFGKKNKYESDVVFGEKYRDDQTGIEGTAVVISFFQHACERVSLELVVDGKIEEYTFDAPRLTRLSTGDRATTEEKGGPDRGTSHVQRGHLGRG